MGSCFYIVTDSYSIGPLVGEYSFYPDCIIVFFSLLLVLTSLICIKYLFINLIKYIKGLSTEVLLILLKYIPLLLFLIVIVLLSLGVSKEFPTSGEVENIINGKDEVDWDYILDSIEDSNLQLYAAIGIAAILY